MNRRAISFVLVLFTSFMGLVLTLALPKDDLLIASAQGNIIINEVDSDTLSTDALEFIELYDGGVGNTDLTGLIVVFFNGNGDVSYAAFDLDGFSTDANGYFLLGNTAVAPSPDITFSNNTLQNGADAVAVYMGNANDFPNGTPTTTSNLIDALVYDTGQADDAGLLVLLNPGQPQVNEAGGGDEEGDSNQRCPNGSGGTHNTNAYTQDTPTPGAANNCGSPPVSVRIRDIQGAGHKSSLDGQSAQDVPGIVTALAANGFYLQDSNPDDSVATSEGIFVFTSSAPSVNVGDELLVNGLVSEFYPGGASTGNLSITELTAPLSITVQSSGHALPSPVIIGNGGRVPPNQIIDDDAGGNVETGGSFDASQDGIDFYESMEGMLVQVNDAVVVGSTTGFGEITVLSDNGINAGIRSSRGGVVIQASDFNPERVILDDELISSEPRVNVGDRFTAPITGVISYSFGNFKLLNAAPLSPATSAGLTQEVVETTVVTTELSVATFNVENFHPNVEAAKLQLLASQVITNLKSPDIIGVEEIQDNSGPTDDGTVDASATYNALINAIQAAGGPAYEFREIAPQNNQDGGQPGGNIRVGFLFRPDKVNFIDRPGGTAITGTTVISGATSPELTFSPGRIDPTNSAWNDSRKPLVGEFEFNGQKIFVIVNHLNSKTGDDPLFGRNQPPTLVTEAQRTQQAAVINSFVDDILAIDASAKIVVLGDLNEFDFRPPLDTLKGGVLTNLVEVGIPLPDRYTFIFDGNSQALDHILISDGVLDNSDVRINIVHVNAEFYEDSRATDHDPVLARFDFAGSGGLINEKIYLPAVLKN